MRRVPATPNLIGKKNYARVSIKWKKIKNKRKFNRMTRYRIFVLFGREKMHS